MIPLADVLRPHGVDLAGLPAAEADPFAQEGALQEAQLLSVRFDAVTGVAGLLFEMRPSLQVRDANTGVLVARRVRELSWSSPARSGGLSAWPVGSSTTHRRAGMVRFELDMWPAPGASLSFEASDADFFLGRVPGLTAAPPDYTEVSPKEADGRIADWNSSFVPVGLSRCLPIPPDARVG